MGETTELIYRVETQIEEWDSSVGWIWWAQFNYPLSALCVDTPLSCNASCRLVVVSRDADLKNDDEK